MKEKLKERLKKKLKEGWRDIYMVLYHQGLFYVPQIIQTELISPHHNDLLALADLLGIQKTRELVARKYHWDGHLHDVENYVKGCDVCLASKAVRHKPYGNLQLLPVQTYQGKDLSMDFVTGLPISTDWKGDNYK